MKRNSSIDYLKFLFSIVIVLYHYGLWFDGGYIVVEGFFMITGFLMMGALYRKKDVPDTAPDSTAKFVFRKYKAIFLPLLFSAISGYLIYELLIFEHTAKLALKQLPYMLFEVFPLQMAGFDTFCATGVSWYLSAMLLGLAILYPFAKRNPEGFAYTVCPPLVLLVYGFLCVQYHQLDVNSHWILGVLNAGVLRAMAGIAAGCFLYALVLRAKTELTLKARACYTVLELAALCYLFRSMMTADFYRTGHDFVMVAVLFGILYLALSEKSLIAHYCKHRYTKILATWSTYIYLNHYAWNIYFKNVLATNKSPLQLLPWYLLCVAASCTVAWSLSALCKFGCKKIAQKKWKGETA